MTEVKNYVLGHRGVVDGSGWQALHVAAHASDKDESVNTLIDSQVPWGVGALGGSVSETAWRGKPRRYLVADDRMIPQPAPRAMAERAGSNVIEVAASHAVNVSQPAAALARLADEQAALRRVATLVARAVPATEIFAAVSEEVADLFGDERGAAVVRFDYGVPGIEFAGVSKAFDVVVGTRWDFQDGMATTQVFRTGRAARVDAWDCSQMRGAAGETFRRLGPVSTIATPILVDCRLWGAMVLSTGDQPLPLDTEERLVSFTELVATAIANAESRDTLAQLAGEQAALRRVATLVARGVLPREVFDAVCVEVGRLFGLEQATFGRFDPEGSAFEVLGVARPEERMSVGSRWELNDLHVARRIYQTGESAFVNEHDLRRADRPVVELWSPIVVDDRLWGALTVIAREQLPLDADVRLERFSELLATAIAKTDNKFELAASRRRIVAASDDARRRIERDLHDGTQQRLVALSLAARAAETGATPDDTELRSELAKIATGLNDALTELQHISRGIHPAIVSQGGLGPALRTLGRRSPIPVELDVTTYDRFPPPVEIAAYYATSESLANAAKHSRASHIEVSLAVCNSHLLLSIRDDGIGGVDPARGTGLIGLTDRIEALGGSLRVQSPSGNGTHIAVDLPLEGGPETGP
jgi:signal transduction histidine kinase